MEIETGISTASNQHEFAYRLSDTTVIKLFSIVSAEASLVPLIPMKTKQVCHSASHTGMFNNSLQILSFRGKRGKDVFVEPTILDICEEDMQSLAIRQGSVCPGRSRLRGARHYKESSCNCVPAQTRRLEHIMPAWSRLCFICTAGAPVAAVDERH
ncbi:hypothetical protein JOB18_026496 [Solea senegalensis]|uniref:Uncharacterized protein n=1 Tax=Solea senegalensis TaxID=28829 RepID=A0AAV6RCG7_SOLSE|nr:hypothetical protein JOB18_026496 [Solea senegalensis]